MTLSRVARETVAFTGTPILNKKGATLLIRWLEGNVQFRVTEKNFVVVTNAMISYSPPPRVKEEVVEMPFGLTEAEQREYNAFQEDKDLQQMVRVCHRATLRKLVEVVEGTGLRAIRCFWWRRTPQAQENWRCACGGFAPVGPDRVLEDGDDALPTGVDAVDSIDLTEIRKVQGREGRGLRRRDYAGTLQCRVQPDPDGGDGVWGVLGNEADREQVRGRIPPPLAESPCVRHVYVHTGVLSAIRQDHWPVAARQSASSSRRSGTQTWTVS